jgi:hypothetical protein
VSKKTVTFKMPVRSARAEDESPQSLALDQEQQPPILESAGAESGQDEWVRRAEADHTPAVVAAPSLARGPIKAVTIDLTVERDFPAVAMLMLTIPPMLGWFYLANVMNRYWGRLG